jgi:hypothetical protein
MQQQAMLSSTLSAMANHAANLAMPNSELTRQLTAEQANAAVKNALVNLRFSNNRMMESSPRAPGMVHPREPTPRVNTPLPDVLSSLQSASVGLVSLAGNVPANNAILRPQAPVPQFTMLAPASSADGDQKEAAEAEMQQSLDDIRMDPAMLEPVCSPSLVPVNEDLLPYLSRVKISHDPSQRFVLYCLEILQKSAAPYPPPRSPEQMTMLRSLALDQMRLEHTLELQLYLTRIADHAMYIFEHGWDSYTESFTLPDFDLNAHLIKIKNPSRKRKRRSTVSEATVETVAPEEKAEDVDIMADEEHE